jgi:hypothetical protein
MATPIAATAELTGVLLVALKRGDQHSDRAGELAGVLLVELALGDRSPGSPPQPSSPT